MIPERKMLAILEQFASQLETRVDPLQVAQQIRATIKAYKESGVNKYTLNKYTLNKYTLYVVGRLFGKTKDESGMRQWCEKNNLIPEEEAEVMGGFSEGLKAYVAPKAKGV